MKPLKDNDQEGNEEEDIEGINGMINLDEKMIELIWKEILGALLWF